MKKTICILAAAVLFLVSACIPALAEGTPQPEGGKVFEGLWGKMCGLVDILYEEEGYRVSVELYNPVEETGTQWEYSCFYMEDQDILESISSRKISYTLDPETKMRSFGEYEYEGVDDEGQTSSFSLSEEGALEWTDGREDRGDNLQFSYLGSFEGDWRSADGDVYVEFRWQGLFDEDTFFYDVFIDRGGDGEDTDLHLEGILNPGTGMLECYETAPETLAEAGEGFTASFTDPGNGKILFEDGENSVELEYDLLGAES